MRKSGLVVAVLLSTVSCGSGDESTTNSSTTTAASSSIPTTTQTTTTTVVPGQGFDPECVDSPNEQARFQFADETALDEFGPLSTAPSLQITMPLGLWSDLDQYLPPRVTVNRIAGGVLLSARADPYARSGGSLLTAIDADGTVRWVNCYDEQAVRVFVAPAATVSTVALVGFATSESDESSSVAWRAFDLESGDALADPNQSFANLEPSDHDLASLALASAADQVQLGLSAAGEVVISERNEHSQWVPVAAYHHGRWTNDAALLGEIPAIRVGGQFDGSSQLYGFAPDGSEVWRVTDLQFASGENLAHQSSGSVTVMVGCPPDDCVSRDGSDPYNAYGIDTATGARLWTRAGFNRILVAGDGYALITGPDGRRELINVNTGDPADPSQQWSSNSYAQGCCDDVNNWVALDGGLLIAVTGEHVDVWFPAALAPETHDVTIP